MRCLAEMCLNWTGHGCVCEVMDLEPHQHPDTEWADGDPEEWDS